MDLYAIRNQLNAGKSIYDLPLRVTYYARVSTDKDEQLHSLKAQVKYYSDFIVSNPDWRFVEGYVDEGLSGTNVSKRESFLKMIEDARLGKFDFIVTKEISRFSRNTIDSIQYTQTLLGYGVGVLFQSDNINTLMPDSELRLTIMSSIAQDEVRKTSERVKFGFKRAIEKGVVLGNNRIWGYKKDEGRLIVVPEEAEMVQAIFDMYAYQKMGMRTIATWLSDQGYLNGNGNPFSFSTIKGILTNPKYKGYYCGGKTHKYDYKLSDIKYLDQTEWVMYKDETGEIVPAIVSEELWDKANRILSARSEKMSSEDRSSYQNKYPYSGKIICMEHNTPYHRAYYQYKSGGKEVWQCRLYAAHGKAGCTSPILYTTELNEILRQATEMLVTNKAEIIHELIKIYSDIGSQSKIKEDMAKMQGLINDFLKKKDKLLDLSIKGKITDDEFEQRNDGFNAEIVSLKERIAELKEQEQKNKDISETVDILRGLIANELDFKEGFSEGLVDSLLDRIEVYKTENKNEVKLKVFLKIVKEELPFAVKRSRNNTSVCYNQYI